jgi:hypothetical protein
MLIDDLRLKKLQTRILAGKTITFAELSRVYWCLQQAGKFKEFAEVAIATAHPEVRPHLLRLMRIKSG